MFFMAICGMHRYVSDYFNLLKNISNHDLIDTKNCFEKTYLKLNDLINYTLTTPNVINRDEALIQLRSDKHDTMINLMDVYIKCCHRNIEQ